MSTTNKGQLTKFNTFAVSAASGMSGWLFVHPMDVIKVRMQLENSNPAELRAGSPITLASNLVKNEGVLGLYSGLSAALLRQATYTTMRLALYDIFKDYTKGLTGVQMADQAAAAVTSGGIASFLACPVEVCLARMQADGALPVDQRRGYTGVVDAFRSIAAKEGLSTFFRGAAPTVARAAVVSTTQLVSYDQAKALYSSFLGEV
jgi:solute carrier family 25 oxoglutarate transporter 11